MWDLQLDALPEAEGASALAAVFYLKVAQRNFRKLRLSPIKKSLEFEALVARVAGPEIGPQDAQDPGTFSRSLIACATPARWSPGAPSAMDHTETSFIESYGAGAQ